MGYQAGYYTSSGDYNVALGYRAGFNISTGTNNIFLGRDAGGSGSPGGEITTASNTMVLGDENITDFNCQVSLTVASDQRDKTDFTALDLGMNFVKALKPYTFNWDKRSKYIDKTDPSVDLNKVTTDGTHKEDQLDVGFKAQDVVALEEASNYIFRSNPGNYDQFDWTVNYLILPE